MRREDLYHVVAAAAQIVGESEFVVVGSQAILGSHADAPEALLRSLRSTSIRVAHPTKPSLSRAPSATARISSRRSAITRTQLAPRPPRRLSDGRTALSSWRSPRGPRARCVQSRSASNLMTWFCRSSPRIENVTGNSPRTRWMLGSWSPESSWSASATCRWIRNSSSQSPYCWTPSSNGRRDSLRVCAVGR
jgi:hypothetical protein